MMTLLQKKTKEGKEDLIKMKLTRVIITRVLNASGKEHIVVNKKRNLNVKGMTHHKVNHQMEKRNIPESDMIHLMKTILEHLLTSIDLEAG